MQKEGNLDPAYNRKICGAHCFSMYYGEMAPCPIMMYIKTFNRYFQKDYPEEQPINLDENISFEAFMKKMYQPMRLCAYCNQTKSIPWHRIPQDEKADIGDWLSDG